MVHALHKKAVLRIVVRHASQSKFFFQNTKNPQNSVTYWSIFRLVDAVGTTKGKKRSAKTYKLYHSENIFRELQSPYPL